VDIRFRTFVCAITDEIHIDLAADQLFQRSSDLVLQGSELIVDEQSPVRTDRNPDVSAPPLQHVHGPGDVSRRDLHVRHVLLSSDRTRKRNRQRASERERGHESAASRPASPCFSH
jgi:hypothetical protein